MVALTTAGLGRGDPLVAALLAALAAHGPVAGPLDLGSSRPSREGPPLPDLLRAPLHVHVPGEPAEILHLLRHLAAAGVPLAAAARGAEHPMLILAGPAALPNPEPLAAFFDVILVGDLARDVTGLVEVWHGARGHGRGAVAAGWLRCPGAYVPSAYTPAYREDGTLASVAPSPGAPLPVVGRWVPPPPAASPPGRQGARPLGPHLWGWDYEGRGRPRGVTAVLGAAREALRRHVGVLLTDAEMEGLLGRIAAARADQVELEFTLGLPGETDAEADGIVALIRRLRHRLLQAEGGARRFPEILPAVTTFFPQPWTAAQWAPLADVQHLGRRHKELARALAKVGNVSLLHDVPKWAYVQALLARGDRRMAGLFTLALETNGDWREACRRWHLNADFFVYRPRRADEVFPWDHLAVGVAKAALREEAAARGLLSSLDA